jgi:hypothetical protein
MKFDKCFRGKDRGRIPRESRRWRRSAEVRKVTYDTCTKERIYRSLVYARTSMQIAEAAANTRKRDSELQWSRNAANAPRVMPYKKWRRSGIR